MKIDNGLSELPILQKARGQMTNGIILEKEV